MQNDHQMNTPQLIKFSEWLILITTWLVIGSFTAAAFLLAVNLGANWDEYFYLSKVHLLKTGALERPLQSFHTHLFAWVTETARLEIDQIIHARLVVWACVVSTCAMLYSIGRLFLSRIAAVTVPFLLLTFSYFLEHATSFRADSIAVFFVTLSCWLSMARSRSGAIAAGTALSLAFAITIKSVLLLPAWFGLFALGQLRNGTDFLPRLLRRSAWVLASALLVGSLLFLYHWLHLSSPTTTAIANTLSGSLYKTILESGAFPRWDYLRTAIQDNPLFVFLLLVGALVVLSRSIRHKTPRQSAEAICLLLLFAPIASFVYYRNAFPYFYAFVLPLPALLCGIALDSLSGEKLRLFDFQENRIRLLLVGLILVSAAWGLYQIDSFLWGAPLLGIVYITLRTMTPKLTPPKRNGAMSLVVLLIVSTTAYPSFQRWRALDRSIQDNQRQLLEFVHSRFEPGTAYIDRCSMISSFSKMGFFMSTWGMDRYLQTGKPIISHVIEDHQPQFLLANHPALDPEGRWSFSTQLLPADREALQENFVHFWGPIWLPGKRLSLKSGATQQTDVQIPGLYLLEASAPLRIGARIINPGSNVFLQAARYEVENLSSDQDALLRLDIGERPAYVSPLRPLFRGFAQP